MDWAAQLLVQGAGESIGQRCGGWVGSFPKSCKAQAEGGSAAWHCELPGNPEPGAVGLLLRGRAGLEPLPLTSLVVRTPWSTPKSL